MFVKFQLSDSNSFLDMSGSQMYSGVLCPLHAPRRKNVTPEISIWTYL